MLIATYKAPNAKHYRLDRVEFHRDGHKLTAKLLNTHAGLALTCESRAFVKRAEKLAVAYYHKI